jgi:hypothetical protein
LNITVWSRLMSLKIRSCTFMRSPFTKFTAVPILKRLGFHFCRRYQSQLCPNMIVKATPIIAHWLRLWSCSRSTTPNYSRATRAKKKSQI